MLTINLCKYYLSPNTKLNIEAPYLFEYFEFLKKFKLKLLIKINRIHLYKCTKFMRET